MVPENQQQVLKELYAFRRHLIGIKKQNIPLTLSDINKECEVMTSHLENLRVVRSESSPTFKESFKVTEATASRNLVDEVIDSIWLIMFEIWARVAQVDHRLYPRYCQLSNIQRQLLTFKLTGVFTASDLMKYRDQIHNLDEYAIMETKFLDPKVPVEEQIGDRVPAGQALLYSMHTKIHRLLDLLTYEADHVDPKLEPMRERLVQISHELEGIKGKEYLAEDIAPYQRELHEIEVSKNSIGVFGAEERKVEVPAGQVIHDLTRSRHASQTS